MASRLLIVGSANVGKKAFCSELRRLANPEKQSGSMDNHTKNAIETLFLVTKYYKAQIEVDIWTLPSAKDPKPDINILKSKGYEGLICVVHIENILSYSSINEFIQDITNEGIHFEVSMLVYHSPQTRASKKTAADNCLVPCDISKIESYCIDNGLELIEIEPKDTNFSSSQNKQDRRGMDRVLEALQCTMWRSMIPAQKESAQSNAPIKDPKNEPINEEIADSEEPLDDLESLLHKVRHVRETGKNLSDHERRENAEAVARLLWEALSISDSDEEP